MNEVDLSSVLISICNIKPLSNVINHKPVHDCPFPVYPLLHLHVKLPTVLVQAALLSQLSVLVEHSSMSRK